MTHEAENTHDRALGRKRSPLLALTITTPALKSELPTMLKEEALSALGRNQPPCRWEGGEGDLRFSRAGDRAELLEVISEASALGTIAQSGSLKSRDKRKRKACLGPLHRCHCDCMALGRCVLPVTKSK